MAVRSPKKRMTYAQYSRLPDDGLRYELIGGDLYVTPAPNTRHQEVVARLLVRLATHLESAGGGRMFVAPYEVDFFDEEAVQPDLIFISDADAHIVTEAKVVGVPTMVIEVLSSASRDRRLKRNLYERRGVPEYWIVDPDAGRVEIYRLRDGRYGRPLILKTEDQLRTPLIPGFSLDLSYLFRR